MGSFGPPKKGNARVSGNCSRCNRQIAFVQRWNEKWVCCEVEPDEVARESFVEIELGEFVSVFRHDCEERSERPKYQPLNQVFRGDKKKFARRPRAQPGLFADA